jgi:hypothetical protein
MPVRTDTVRIDGLLDFLNVEVAPGDALIEATLVGSDLSGDRRKVHILGPPDSLSIDLRNRELFADGNSLSNGTVRVFDRWGYQLSDGVTVTVDADSGRILANDLERDKDGSQIGVENGAATFMYKAGSMSGAAKIRATVGALQVSEVVLLKTPLEKFSVVGLASATGQSLTAHRDRTGLQDDESYPDGLKTDGRLAVYARGTVLKDYRLIASYDTDRKDRTRFYRDLDPDFLYSIYGDNSMLSYDAQTTHPLYLRLERDKSYAMVGDFNTDLTKQEFTLYNRTLYGVKANHETEGWRLSGFGSLTDRKVVQREIRGTGLSGLYDLGSINLTPGSEKVRVETRDRFHSEVILKQADLYRFGDYEIDYAQGTIFFKQPVPAIDGNGNPVYIVIAYEAYDNREKSFLAGGRVEHDLISKCLTLGVNGVVEEQQPTNYSLLGGDLKFTPTEQVTVNGELGRSDHFTGSGLAYKIETDLKPVPEVGLRGYYRQVEQGFLNVTQSGSGRELGTRKYGATGTLTPLGSTKIVGDYYKSRQETQADDVTIESASGELGQKLAGNLAGSLKLEDLHYDGPSRDTVNGRLSKHSLLGSAEMTYALSERLTVSAREERNLGKDQDITRPNATILSGNYKVIESVTLQANQKFYEDGGSLSFFGITSTPVEGTSLYGKYEIGNAIGQNRNMLSIGLKNRLKLPWDLTANFGFERAKDLQARLEETPTDDHTAVSGSLEYLPELSLKGSFKAEYGDDLRTKKWNYFAGLDYRAHRDVSLIGKYLLSCDEAKQGNGHQTRYHLILGTAYRPVMSDWLNVIGKYEMKGDLNSYLAPFLDDRASIVSVHAFLEPVRRVELGMKYAFKRGQQSSENFDFASHTSFYLVNARFNITQLLDIGGEYRLLHQDESGGDLSGYNAETGYALIKNMRVAAGYNFKGFKEQDLVDYSFWSEGPYMRVSFKFDESLFGGL